MVVEHFVHARGSRPRVTGQHMHESGHAIGRGSLQNGAVIHHHHPSDIQLPGIYRAADAASAVGQRIAFWLRGTQLLLLVAAATFAIEIVADVLVVSVLEVIRLAPTVAAAALVVPENVFD